MNTECCESVGKRGTHIHLAYLRNCTQIRFGNGFLSAAPVGKCVKTKHLMSTRTRHNCSSCSCTVFVQFSSIFQAFTVRSSSFYRNKCKMADRKCTTQATIYLLNSASTLNERKHSFDMFGGRALRRTFHRHLTTRSRWWWGVCLR